MQTDENRFSILEKVERSSTLTSYDVYSMDLNTLKSQLTGAPNRMHASANSTLLLPFPNAKGEIQEFRVYEASILHPDLANQFQDIKSYVGFSTTDRTAVIRFSTTVFGFHGMILSSEGTTFIDPYTTDRANYVVYFKSAAQTDRLFECMVEDVEERMPEVAYFSPKNAQSIESNTGIFRTYRLALASTVEYSQFHINQAGLAGGTLAQRQNAVLAAMNVTMNRVNGIFERDMSLTMQIIPFNTAIIFINPENPDTLSNTSSMINQIQEVIDNAIGFSEYDIGHVFSTGGGGIASLNSPCTVNKARGVTGSFAPVGDPFDVDYVAHEMGHQFGATHTQNNSCQRTAATAVEPGSASTIMGYAGICAPNVQNNSDAHFHAVSMAQMDNFVAGTGNCSDNIGNNNAAPVIQPLSNYTIPISTPFVLTAVATDANNDALTYCWEQIDNQVSQQPPLTINTEGPNFRSLPPTTSGARYFPALPTVLTGATDSTWEVVPSVSRNLNFAVTVRDNRTPNGGQTARANNTITTTAAAGPFVVTAPNTLVSWPAGSNQTVTWNVAGTTANGVNTPLVDIYLSTNAGFNFPILLASQVPNDGSEIITVPNTVGSLNRIMVMGHGNVFYDVSNVNFNITAAPSSMAIGFSGVAGEQNKSECRGNTITYTFPYTTFGGYSTPTTFSVTGQPTGSTVTFTPNTLSANGTVTMQVETTALTPIGFYTLAVTATSGAQTRTVNFYLNLAEGGFGPVVLQSPANGATGVNPSNVPFSWTSSAGATGYDIQIATDSNFTNIIETGTSASASYTASSVTSSTTLYWRVRPKNVACAGNYTTASSFSTIFCGTIASTNVPVAIPVTAATVSSTLTIPTNQNVTIQKVTVNLQLTHTWMNDLIVTLISPTGTQVQLMNRECVSNPAFQNVSATFDDGGAVAVCQTAPNPALSGVILPEQPLSAFNNQNSQGLWTLQVQDVFDQDGGAIVNWSLTICSINAPLSIEDTKVFDFNLYPNPSNGTFTLQMDNTNGEPVDVSVYDMRGRILFDATYNTVGAMDETIQLQNVQTGVYLVSVKSGNAKEVKRIIIE
ncbi:metalloprotease Fpp1 [Flavobacterium orientale]|uniref:Metalloprotease Fpp1 n=2 Tax=Flavobacterium orientale TaxID=1756020 RepID=A0A917DAL0_9FLAO|nr:metalloprotease Fpp1 [Flavobacterium orientale]